MDFELKRVFRSGSFQKNKVFNRVFHFKKIPCKPKFLLTLYWDSRKTPVAQERCPVHPGSFWAENLKKVKMKKLILLGLGATAVSAQAGVLMEMQTGMILNPEAPATSASFPNMRMFTFNQFDDMGGSRVLCSVTLELTGFASANVEADNESGNPSIFTASLNGSIDATIPGLSATATLFDAEVSPLVAADEAADGMGDFAGPDYHDFGVITDTASDSDTIVAGLAPYIGLGTIDGTTMDNQAWIVNGGGDAASFVNDSESKATWTVIYKYSPVPEPSSLLGLGFCFAGMMGLRRR